MGKKTEEYVLWVNYLPPRSIVMSSYGVATYIVATAKSSVGPFVVVNKQASVQITGGGDFDLFVDVDGAAYIAYDAWGNNHQVVIEKLTEDYRDSLGSNVTTGPLTPSSN